MLIGVENVIVITKSVVSTPIELDVKYRVASGEHLFPLRLAWPLILVHRQSECT